mmetsp:Transcript_11681/g.21387  ORF Transcript_11681/g.21387 Transcript_11681/m.21387 type:complete len:218 (+) Transcript_11681:91-744(+)
MHQRDSIELRACSSILTRQELCEHLQRLLWLIERHHVASIKHLQEGQSIVCSQLSRHFAVDFPVFVFGLVELLFSSPTQIFRPGLVSNPITHEVYVSRVNQHARVIVKQRRHSPLELVHPVFREHAVDSRVAALPLFVDSERILHMGLSEPVFDVGEIVAQRFDLTLLANVVRVQTCLVVGSEFVEVAEHLRIVALLVVLVAHLDLLQALWNGVLHR